MVGGADFSHVVPTSRTIVVRQRSQACLSESAAGHVQRLTYVSAPLGRLGTTWTGRHLHDLEEACRQRNASIGVGGLLLYYAPYCFEVLEGFPDVVGPLFHVIRQDSRFGRVILLEDIRCSERHYASWSMRRLDQEPLPAMIPLILHQVAGAFLNMWQYLPRSAADIVRQGKDPRSQPAVSREVVICFIRLVEIKAIQAEPAFLRPLADLLGLFVDVCVDTVQENDGEVAKFLNGQCMAYWPAASAASAFAAVKGVFARLEEIRRNSSPDSASSLMHVRIGLHSGKALLCNAGTQRADFTLLGDCVNVASRLMSQASILRLNLVTSAAVCSLLEPGDLASLRDIGPQQLKGRVELVHCYADCAPPPDVDAIRIAIKRLAEDGSTASGAPRPLQDFNTMPPALRPPIFDDALEDPPSPTSCLRCASTPCLGRLARTLTFRRCAHTRRLVVSLTYISIASSAMAADELEALSRLSARHNRKANITSDLLYVSGTFVQRFEGSPAAVRTLWRRLQSDPRHTQIVAVHIVSLTTRTCRTPLRLNVMGSDDLRGLKLLPDLLRQLARSFQCLETYLQFPVLQTIISGRDPFTLPSVRVTLVMLAADIVSFSRLSEGCELTEVWQMCTTFIDLCTREIESAGGHVMKMIGDCVEAYFAPSDANAALMVAKRIAQVCAAQRQQLHPLDCRAALTCGVGLDCGPVVLAHCGSPSIARFTEFGEVIRRVVDVEGLSRVAKRQIVLTQPVVDLLPSDCPLVSIAPSEDTAHVRCYALAGEEWALDLEALRRAIEAYQSACRSARAIPADALQLPTFANKAGFGQAERLNNISFRTLC